MSEYVRPTKKQRELLDFIEKFIAEHGYSPSYREIMNGLQYNSVATVALHVGNLIKRGHLRKRDHSARSLEVVREPQPSVDGALTGSSLVAEVGDDQHEQWLLRRITERLGTVETADREEAQTLVNALRLLGFEEPAEKLVLQLNRAE